MNQNISITVTIIIAFIVSFTILFFYMNYYSETLNNINNQQILETPNKNYILIFGSSYVGALNLPHIENKLNDEGQQYVVPKITSYAIEHTEKLIPKIIDLEPKIVIFGVGYRDLGYMEMNDDNICKYNNMDLQPSYLTTKYFLKNLINRISAEYEPILHILDKLNQNPKWVTINSIDYILTVFKTNSFEINLENNQLNKIKNPKLVNNIYLVKNSSSSIRSIDELNQNDPNSYCLNVEHMEIRLNSLDHILSKLKSKNIEVVLFTPPYVKSYNEKIPSNIKKTLDNRISKLGEKYGVDYYNLSRSFEKLNIFEDHTHVAKTHASLQYSGRVLYMIDKFIVR